MLIIFIIPLFLISVRLYTYPLVIARLFLFLFWRCLISWSDRETLQILNIYLRMQIRIGGEREWNLNNKRLSIFACLPIFACHLHDSARGRYIALTK